MDRSVISPTWEDHFTAMTKDQAEYVRFLRVEEELTWREVATQCADKWDGDWHSLQIAGMGICERAAAVLGQNWN